MFSVLRASLIFKCKYQLGLIQCRWTSSFKLLRSFYLAVHPDLFNGYPEEQKTNEESLKVLNSYLDSLERSHPVFSTSLTFYVKDHNTSTGNTISQVSISLASKSTSEAIGDILEACNLPVEKAASKYGDGHRGWADSLQVFGSEKDMYSSFVGDLRFGHFNVKEVLTLDSWLKNNCDTVEDNLKHSEPLKAEASATLARLKEKHGIQGVSKDSLQYSYSLLSSGMKQLEYVLDRDFKGHHGCEGKIIKFGYFNGMDQLGRLVFNINDLPSDWKQALILSGGTAKNLEKIKEVERSLRESCFGLKFIRPRTSHSYPVQLYLKDLMDIHYKQKEELVVEKHILKDVLAILEWDDDFPALSTEGYVRVPNHIGRKALFHYIKRNLSRIKKARKDYLRNLQREQSAMESCKSKLGLSSLEKDYMISSTQTVDACHELCTFEEEISMQNWCVMLSNYYSVSSEGLVRIPWNFTRERCG